MHDPMNDRPGDAGDAAGARARGGLVEFATRRRVTVAMGVSLSNSCQGSSRSGDSDLTTSLRKTLALVLLTLAKRALI